jgi:hypothetical protein
MEMPKNCFECPFSVIDYRVDGQWCSALGKQVYWDRDKECPIICSLPEGHGRLVDEKSVRWAIDDIVLEIANRTGRVGMTKDETMEYINSLCTIVPAERREEK